MSEMELPQLPITYYAKKSRLLLAFMACLILTAAGYLMITDYRTSTVPYNAVTLPIIAYSGVILSGIGAIVLLCAFVMRKVTLFTISEEGILTRGRKIITWDKMADIRIVRVQLPDGGELPPMVGIFLKDLTAYYATLSPLAQKIASVSEKTAGTPVVLSYKTTDVDPAALTAWLNHYRTQYSHG